MEAKNASYPWYALQVRSSYENVVRAYLGGKGYECFLPLYTCRRRWSDRFQKIEVPLFPGYVFCRFNPLNRLPILMVPGVVQVVGCGRTPIPIDDTEIAPIQAAVKSGFPSEPWPFLQIGQRVSIEFGPLRGLEGVLLELKGHHRLVLSVTLLRRSVAVQVDKAWTRPLSEQHQPHTGPVTPYCSSWQPTA